MAKVEMVSGSHVHKGSVEGAMEMRHEILGNGVRIITRSSILWIAKSEFPEFAELVNRIKEELFPVANKTNKQQGKLERYSHYDRILGKIWNLRCSECGVVVRSVLSCHRERTTFEPAVCPICGAMEELSNAPKQESQDTDGGRGA